MATTPDLPGPVSGGLSEILPIGTMIQPGALRPTEVPEHVPVPERERRGFLTLVAQLCRTLAYLHGEGIVHRDIKPQNVIIRPDGTPVLLDFGLASYFGAGGRESLEIGGKVEGTPEYMSPEQIRGELVDARSDLYAVGCILYEGMTGRVPFRSGTAVGTLRAHIKVPPVPPRSLVEDVPEELETVILRLLAKRSGDRLGYARDVEEALSRMGFDPGDWARDRPARDYLYRPEFVGRAEVLASLENDIRLSLRWPGRCIFLRGKSGVGKTRVIVELARRLEAGGLAVVTGECLPIGVEVEGDAGPGVRATPLHPFRTLLQSVADACLEQGPGESSRLIGPRARLLSECEPSLTNLPGLVDDETPTPSDGSGDGHRSRLIDALGETLNEFGRNAPVVVFLDDLQWADTLTLHFLALFHIGAWDSPNVAIVAAYRTEEEDDAMKGYRRVFEDAKVVDLGPLGEESLGQIIGGMLGSREADDRLVRHLAGRSGGNPFYVAEYLRAAVSEGLLRRDERGSWRACDAGGNPVDPEALDVAIPLPGSIHELIVRRLSRLTDDGRRLLELAAVFGREVDAELLDAVGLLGEHESMVAVEALLVAQILEECRDGRFRFAHDTLREVAYEQIPPERRRALHRMVARAIERRLDRRKDFPRHYATLAHHWYRAIGDRSADPVAASMAIDYLEKAVTHAANSGMSAEAVGFGRAAARLLGVELPENPAELAQALAVEMERIRRAMAGRQPHELLDLPDTKDRAVDRVIGLLLTIHVPAFISDQFGLFALMASKNLSLTLTHGHGSQAPAVYGMFAIVTRIILDDSRQAHAFGRLAIELDRRRGRTMEADVLFLNNSFLNHWVAPVAETLADCDIGGEAGLRSGAILYGCYNYATYVVMLAASGAPLRVVVEAAEARLALVGHLVLVARFHCILERQLALALNGRTESPTSLTDDTFDEVRDLAFICRTTNANQVGCYHATRMKLHYFRGEYRDALDASDQAHAVRESCARQMVEVDLVFFRALTLLALAIEDPGHRRAGHLQHALELLQTLERWRLDCEANFGHKTLLVQAEFARAEGRDADALRLRREAVTSAEAHGFRQFAALGRELAGRHLERIGDHDAAKSAIREAAEGYRSWGASTLADRLAPLA
jgi:predicted ATPase